MYQFILKIVNQPSGSIQCRLPSFFNIFIIINIMQKKVKVCSFYVVQYPVCWTAQSALHFTSWQTCSFRH